MGADEPTMVSLHLGAGGGVASQRVMERERATARTEVRAEKTLLPARDVEAVREFMMAAIVMNSFETEESGVGVWRFT